MKKQCNEYYEFIKEVKANNKTDDDHKKEILEAWRFMHMSKKEQQKVLDDMGV